MIPTFAICLLIATWLFPLAAPAGEASPSAPVDTEIADLDEAGGDEASWEEGGREAEEASSWQWSGHVAGELRWFPERARYAGQKEFFPTVSFQPELYRSWDGERQSVTIVPFLRLDPVDSERTHFDLREFTWLKSGETWEIRLGLRKVFWGVTESQHLVDIINQTDWVESPDGEEKLGQPMLNLSFTPEWGTIDFFVLPYFRERTFPGREGRLRSDPPVDWDHPRYESAAEEHHIDWAARWFRTLGEWDVGLSHFSGTGRDPTFQFGLDSGGNPALIPYYAQIEQTGLDVQATMEAWLWKFEAISRRQLGERHTAAVGGFEYTLVGIFDSDADLGLIGEYLFDDRGDAAPTPFQNDIMAGMRLALNDVDSTDLLLGTIIDPESGAMAWSVEANRRLWESWKLSVEGRAFVDIPDADPFSAFRRDSFL